MSNYITSARFKTILIRSLPVQNDLVAREAAAAFGAYEVMVDLIQYQGLQKAGEFYFSGLFLKAWNQYFPSVLYAHSSRLGSNEQDSVDSDICIKNGEVK